MGNRNAKVTAPREEFDEPLDLRASRPEDNVPNEIVKKSTEEDISSTRSTAGFDHHYHHEPVYGFGNHDYPGYHAHHTPLVVYEDVHCDVPSSYVVEHHHGFCSCC
ncbi:hypothetical protein M3Y96_00288900 [Aphelenchoides besseyi]|nr:hypothetical protein M3Y96_00288900 [Aphelenchoides besseyi]